MLSATTILLLLVVGGTAFLLFGHHHQATKASTAPRTSTTHGTIKAVVPTTVTPSTVPSAARATIAAIADYVAQSAAVRPTVQRSVDGVGSCTLSPSDGETIIDNAIQTRRDILGGLEGVATTEPTGAGELVTLLTRALQDSTTADQNYGAWMGDVADGTSNCRSSPDEDASFALGQDASVRATADKAAFVALWNSIALQYGQRTYAASDF